MVLEKPERLKYTLEAKYKSIRTTTYDRRGNDIFQHQAALHSPNLLFQSPATTRAKKQLPCSWGVVRWIREKNARYMLSRAIRGGMPSYSAPHGTFNEKLGINEPCVFRERAPK